MMVRMDVRRILVPLDGSRLAEASLPAAASVAGKLGSCLILLHVLERDAPSTVHGEAHLRREADARSYLEAHAERLRSDGLQVEVDVHKRPVADVAAALDRHAHELDADLISMCAHGRTNLRERALGTKGEQILRGGSIPILLRTVRRPHDRPFELESVLVPLDFGHDVDTAIDAARTFARPYGATITLLTVPEGDYPASRLLPSATTLARRFAHTDASRRLEELAGALRGAGLDTTAAVADGDPPDAIAVTAAELPSALIVLVTDAHGGLRSWYDPSTVQHLLALDDLTLLLIKEL